MNLRSIVSIKDSLVECLRFIPFVRRYRRALAMLSFASMIPLCITLLLPMFMRQGIDKGIMEKDFQLFFMIAITGAVLSGVSLLATQWRQMYQTIVKNKVAFLLRHKVINCYLQRDISFHIDNDSSQGTNRIMFDTDRISESLTSIPIEFVEMLPRMVFSFYFIFILDRTVGLFFIIAAPIIALPIFLTHEKIRSLHTGLWEYFERILMGVRELFAHVLLIKAFNRERYIKHSIIGDLVTHIRRSIEIARFEFILMISHNVITRGLVGVIGIYACVRVIRGDITLGTLSAILAYAGQIVSLQSHVSFMLRRLVVTAASCKRVNEIMAHDEHNIVTTEKGVLIDSLLDKTIRVKHVSFAYRAGKSVLEHIDYSIQPGESLGIVGHSGCGKTTLAYLLLGLLSPQEGSIMIGDNDLRCLNKKSFYEKAAMVMQQPLLMNSSIEDNVRFGHLPASFSDIEEVCRMSEIHTFITGLKDGYKTMIGEEGVKLSQGQKQRIALARALLKKPEFLIMDEGLSAVDSATEADIFANVRQLIPSATIVVISHRLSAIRHCEKIMLIVDPRTVETIGAQELTAASENFKRVFSSQIEFR
ncbi:MAG: ABC transporter ATP-binding protein [Candidatus Omnitrophica bacterium]|nr:ABC transporter ATP-binding protein [Candidatus Omnitrophota bacterium]